MEYPVLLPENLSALSGSGYHVSAGPSSLVTTAAADSLINGSGDPEFSDLIMAIQPPEPIGTTVTFNDAVSTERWLLPCDDEVEPISVNPSAVTTPRGSRSTKWDSLNRIAHNAGRLLKQMSLPNNTGLCSPLSSAGNYGGLLAKTETRVCSPQPWPSGAKEHVTRSSPSQLSFAIDNYRDSMSPTSQVCESNPFNLSFDNKGLCSATRSHDHRVHAQCPDNLISFSSVSPSSKQTRSNNGVGALNYSSIDLSSQIIMSPEESDWRIVEDSFACKNGAPSSNTARLRSIAERERRKRISCKLKKLREVVPNMDKEISYADMLDFAAEYLQGLQSQIQELRKKLDTCKCGRDQVRN